LFVHSAFNLYFVGFLKPNPNQDNLKIHKLFSSLCFRDFNPATRAVESVPPEAKALSAFKKTCEIEASSFRTKQGNQEPSSPRAAASRTSSLRCKAPEPAIRSLGAIGPTSENKRLTKSQV
jgi:hypothetical protein